MYDRYNDDLDAEVVCKFMEDASRTRHVTLMQHLKDCADHVIAASSVSREVATLSCKIALLDEEDALKEAKKRVCIDYLKSLNPSFGEFAGSTVFELERYMTGFKNLLVWTKHVS